MRKKLIVSASMAALLFFGAACGDSNGDENDDAGGSEGTSGQEEGPQGQGEGQQGQQGNAAPEPDMEGIPDVVAEVNGEEIPKGEFVTAYEGRFQQMAMQAQQTGEELDQEQLKKQTAQELVDNEILLQEANERGFEASDKQVDKEMNKVAQQNGLGSPDELLKALNEQGMEEEEVMSQLEIQVQVGQLLADETGDEKPTEKELRELYEQSKAQQEQMGDQAGEMPPFEEAKPQLEEQAQAQKESEAAQALTSDLREDANIDIHL